MKRRVVVTGLGMVTPLGTGIQKNWEAACSGKSGIKGFYASTVTFGGMRDNGDDTETQSQRDAFGKTAETKAFFPCLPSWHWPGRQVCVETSNAPLVFAVDNSK